MESLLSLFDYSDFMPHGHCYLWKPGILWTHVISDAIIGLAYFSIPIALSVFISKRKDLEFKGLFVLFALFIVACGLTHLMAIYTTWNPNYFMEGILKAITALVSILTAIVLWPLIPKALQIPSPGMLLKEQEKLNTRNEELLQLSYRSSHDLVAPMKSIRGIVDLMKDELKEKELNNLPAYLENINSTILQLEHTVKNIVDLSKANVQAETSVIVKFDRKVDAIVQKFQGLINKHNIKIEKNIEALGEYEFPPNRLAQIIENLLSNSIKYHDPKKKERFVRINVKEVSGSISICIIDNGVGLPIDVVNIFEMFQRLHTSEYPSSGLGLYLVKKQVDMMHGTITCQCTEGLTVFEVIIPTNKKENL